MRKLLFSLIFGLFLTVSVHAQVGQPDCLVTVSFTTTGRAVYDNRGLAVPVCTMWHLTYFNEGFSALSIELDEAPSSGGAPGTWVTWPNLSSGTQPLTAITQGQVTGYKYFPWVSINLTSVTGTGTVRVAAYGYRPGLSNDANSAPQAAITTNGSTPIQISTALTSPASAESASVTNISRIADSAGTATVLAVSIFGIDPCAGSGVPKLHTFANITTATTTALVAVSGSTVVFVCEIDFEISSTTAASTVLFEQGTGSACATAPTALTATYTDAASSFADIIFRIGGGSATAIKTSAANGFCAVSTVGSTPVTAVDVTYVQQ